jgi:hypothetical protein
MTQLRPALDRPPAKSLPPVFKSTEYLRPPSLTSYEGGLEVLKLTSSIRLRPSPQPAATTHLLRSTQEYVELEAHWGPKHNTDLALAPT